MKGIKRIRKKRIFGESFKKSVVEKYESGESTVLEMSSDFSITTTIIYRWIHKYSRYYKHGSRVVIEMKSQEKTNQELRNKVKDLEAAVGRKQMEIDYLEKLIEMSEKSLKISIKKKGDTSPLSGSDSTKKNTPGQ